jgi:hypothetical protein
VIKASKIEKVQKAPTKKSAENFINQSNEKSNKLKNFYNQEFPGY